MEVMHDDSGGQSSNYGEDNSDYYGESKENCSQINDVFFEANVDTDVEDRNDDHVRDSVYETVGSEDIGEGLGSDDVGEGCGNEEEGEGLGGNNVAEGLGSDQPFDYFMEGESGDDTSWDADERGNGEELDNNKQATDVEDTYVDSDEEFEEVVVSDDEERGTTNTYPSFDIDSPKFKVGMVFTSREEFKRAVTSHAIVFRRSVKFPKIDKRRIYAVCEDDDCNWRVNALKLPDESTFLVRLCNPKHTCDERFNVKNISAKWLGRKYLNTLKNNPRKKILGFREDVIDEMNVAVSRSQVYRAKKHAIELLEGDPAKQYSMLWDYAEMLRQSNQGSTVILVLDASQKFQMMYICLGALKEGFKAGCRPILGVDSCHLKGPFGGVLLTAVAVDPSNNYYPVAYAVVYSKSGDTWEWFLRLLRADLELGMGTGFTFLSDKQKGLIQAFQEVLPESDHRVCVRHLQGNFRNAGFKGMSLKTALWRAARSSTVGEFNQRMEAIKELDKAAFDWLAERPPFEWSMSHFSEVPKCDMLLNNLCESFTNNILPAREKPIVSMLEWIRNYLMTRLQLNRDRAKNKWRRHAICPKIHKIIQKSRDASRDCRPIKSTNKHYQVSTDEGTQFAVDLLKMTCTCRRWQLSGIPCKHAVAAIVNQNDDLDDYVAPCYHVERYRQVYEPAIMVVPSEHFWEKTNFVPPLPPCIREWRVSRLPTLRRRGSDEPVFKVRRKRGTSMLKRLQSSLSCTRCREPGHNIRSCPNGPNPPPLRKEGSSKQKGKRKVVQDDTEDEEILRPSFPAYLRKSMMLTAPIDIPVATKESTTDLPKQMLTQMSMTLEDDMPNMPTQSSALAAISEPLMWDQLYGKVRPKLGKTIVSMEDGHGLQQISLPPGSTALFSTRPTGVTEYGGNVLKANGSLYNQDCAGH